ncbi:MAG: DnaJ domain-containing protein [Elusimicrobia bacterium]|nr:DnaJ domain-containing protein [Candidatus Liberimonas magnetica]
MAKNGMNDFVNYYKVLNIERASSFDAIKRAYRKMMLKWHPDRNRSLDAHEKSILITQAYDILSNENKKRIYDEVLDSRSAPLQKYSPSETFKKHYSEEKVKRWAKEARKETESRLHKSFEEFEKWWEGNFAGKVVIKSIFEEITVILKAAIEAAPEVIDATLEAADDTLSVVSIIGFLAVLFIVIIIIVLFVIFAG